MKTKKQHIALLSALLLLSSCAGAPTPDVEKGNEDDTSTLPDNTATALVEGDQPEILSGDFGGYDFTILVNDSNLDSRIYMNYDMETESGDIIGDAIYRRNRITEEKFNINISQLAVSNASQKLLQAAAAGDEICDTTILTLKDLSQLSMNGCLSDLFDIPNLDVTKSYWDQNMVEEVAISNRLHYITGDISVHDDMRTACLLFNKELWKDYNLDDPYEMVRSGQWTLDRMYALCSSVTNDLNGDNNLDENDRWGIMSEKSAGNFFYFASGQKMIELDENKLPKLVMSGERVGSVLEKVLSFHVDPYVMIYDVMLQSSTDMVAKASQMFQNELVLIRTAVFEPVPRDMRAMDTDFGVLPMPKFDENQENYYSLVLPDAHAVGIPVTVGDPARTGTIVEYLAYASVDTLKPAFYDVSIQGKYLRDEESLEMMDIIFGSKVYDIGLYYDIGGLYSFLRTLIGSRSTDFTSSFAKVQSGIEAQINTLIEKFEDSAD